MNLTRFALRHRAIVLAGVAVLLLFGGVTFLTMSRRENPEILIRVCVVRTRWPGASPRKVEELVTDPLESAIAKIDEVSEIRSESRQGLSLVFVEMDEHLTAVDQLWDEVRSKVSSARSRLPEGCGPPEVDADFGDVSDVVLALRQVPLAPGGEILRPYSWRELEVQAELVRDAIETIPSVAKADLFGVQDEVITVEIDPDAWAKIDLDAETLRALLEARNIVAPGGEITTGGKRFAVAPSGEFTAVDQIARTLLPGPRGAPPVELGDLPVNVTRGTVDPPVRRVRLTTPAGTSERCLLLGVTMKRGRNVVEMGEEIEVGLRRLRASVLPPDLELRRVNDLPRQVDGLVSDFVGNLWQAMAIVLLVALSMMGWRAALIMATAIPLSMVAALAVVTFFGVELEQFSIASLIIAMGMVVDNAIVVSDNTLRELRERGGDREAAVVRGAWSLATPILTSTLTTVGAFGGMLTIIGSTGEFTRSLPIVVAATLLASYVVAMMITPILCAWLLAPDAGGPPRRRLLAGIAARLRRRPRVAPRPAAGEGRYRRLVRWAVAHRAVTLGGALLALVGALALVPGIGNEFFPSGIRDQFFVHVWLPEGSSIQATGAVCREVEAILRETSAVDRDGERIERLASATTLLGFGGPRLTLTLEPESAIPNYAHVLVNTSDPEESAAWAREVQERVAAIPGARIDVRTYELGPYVKRPVEFRILGDDPAALRAAGERARMALRRHPGMKSAFTDWQDASYRVRIEVDDEAANLAGVTNRGLADTLDALISGGELTTYREGDHAVKVLLRVAGDRRARLLEGLSGISVSGSAGKVPLGAVARVVTDWQPSVIARRDQRRCISVGGVTRPGFLPNEVAASVRPAIQEIVDALPATYRLDVGGSLEKTQESQAKLMNAFLLSFVFILLVLIAQYDSFVMPFVVLASIPLALIGALLGLFLSGWALGFMPSLGVIALAGIVINNAIILIDAIEERLRSGQELPDAIAASGAERLRPIMLSTLTTVGGLIPLAFFGGPMWAGMAWAMIGGLLLSTLMTLFVTPAIYAFVAATLGLRRVAAR